MLCSRAGWLAVAVGIAALPATVAERFALQLIPSCFSSILLCKLDHITDFMRQDVRIPSIPVQCNLEHDCYATLNPRCRSQCDASDFTWAPELDEHDPSHNF
jgi:hypothetical protein